MKINYVLARNVCSPCRLIIMWMIQASILEHGLATLICLPSYEVGTTKLPLLENGQPITTWPVTIDMVISFQRLLLLIVANMRPRLEARVKLGCLHQTPEQKRASARHFLVHKDGLRAQ